MSACSGGEVGRNRDTVRWCLWLIVYIGLGLRVIYAFAANPLDALRSDGAAQFQYAQTLFHPILIVASLAPGYPLLLKAMLHFSHHSRVWIALFTAGLSVCTPWIWYRWMQVHFRQVQNLRSDVPALAGFAALSVLPSWISIYALFMPECLLLPALGLALWASSTAYATKKTSAYVLAGTCWTLAYMTKASMLPLALMTAAWLAFDLRRSRRLIAVSLLSVLPFVLCYGLEVYRGYRTFHAMNMFTGNTPINRICFESGARRVEGTITVTAGSGGEVRKEAFWMQSPSMVQGYEPLHPLSDWKTSRDGQVNVAIDYTKPVGERFPRYDLPLVRRLKYTIENAIFLLFGESYPDQDANDPIQSLQAQMRLLWAPLLMAALLLSLQQRRRDFLTLLCFIPWILFAGQQVYITEGRFRKPLEGLLVAQMCSLLGARYKARTAQSNENAESSANTSEQVIPEGTENCD